MAGKRGWGGALLVVLMSAVMALAAEKPSAGKRVLKNELYEAAEAYLAGHTPWQENQVSITRKYVNELAVPDQDIRLEVKDFKFSKPWGALTVPVTVYVNGQEWRRVQVFMDVNMVARVAVAVRSIRYQEALTSENVRFVRMSLANVPINSVLGAEAKALKNARSRGSIDAGKIITANLVEQTPDVKRGETVALNVGCGDIMLSASGEAREDGYVGEKIKVLNMRSNKILVGVIKERGVVEVSN
jgi:flagella basal body P-ring formation protein FlgA